MSATAGVSGGGEGFLDQERNRGKERDGRGSECLREEDQAVRLGKMRVERHRSDPRCGDDPVDPDAAEPVAVEQSLSGLKQPLAGFRGAGFVRMAEMCRQICLFATRFQRASEPGPAQSPTKHRGRLTGW